MVDVLIDNGSPKLSNIICNRWWYQHKLNDQALYVDYSLRHVLSSVLGQGWDGRRRERGRGDGSRWGERLHCFNWPIFSLNRPLNLLRLNPCNTTWIDVGLPALDVRTSRAPSGYQGLDLALPILQDLLHSYSKVVLQLQTCTLISFNEHLKYWSSLIILYHIDLNICVKVKYVVLKSWNTVYNLTT